MEQNDVRIVVLIATMHNNDILNLIQDMNINTDCIVVNQCNCDKESVERFVFEGKNVILVDSPERGLSKSRNKALSLAERDYDVIVFTDDDIEFSDNYKQLITEAYKDPKKDAIVFNVRRANGSLNKKLGKPVNQISLFRVCSVSITARVSSVGSIRFDERFGAGSNKFILGEENIFVSDCLKKGMKIYTDNGVMCKICDKRPSTWYKGFNDEMLYAKGASFKRMHKYLYMLLVLDFGIRKYRFYKKDISLKNAFKIGRAHV